MTEPKPLPGSASADVVAKAHQGLAFARSAVDDAAEAAARARRAAFNAAREASRAGIPVEQIATALRVSSGTVARWLT